MHKDISTEQKTWQVDNFGNVFRLNFNESGEGLCQRRRGRSFHADGPKREKAECLASLKRAGTAEHTLGTVVLFCFSEEGAEL